MIVERGGRTYELLLGDDADRETMYLEMRDVSDDQAGRVVLFGEKTSGGEFRVLVGSWEDLWPAPGGGGPPFLPLPLVEEFLGWMKARF